MILVEYTITKRITLAYFNTVIVKETQEVKRSKIKALFSIDYDSVAGRSE